MRLAAPGGTYFGTAINGRYVEVNCRERRCGHDGNHVHLFDIQTGHVVTEPAVETEPDSPAEFIRKAG